MAIRVYQRMNYSPLWHERLRIYPRGTAISIFTEGVEAKGRSRARGGWFGRSSGQPSRGA